MMVLKGDKDEVNQQTKGGVTMASQQETGNGSPKNDQSMQVSQAPQLGAQESGTDTSVTMGLDKDYKPDEMDPKSSVAQPKMSITKEEKLISLRQKSEAEIEYVRDQIIPMITEELRNKEKICELLDHVMEYISQCEKEVQKLSPLFKNIALRMNEVFTKPKILARDLESLLTMLKDLPIEDPTEEPPNKEDMPVPLDEPCGSKHQQSSADFEKKLEGSESTDCPSTPTDKDVEESQAEDWKDTTKYKDRKETVEHEDGKENTEHTGGNEITQHKDDEENKEVEERFSGGLACEVEGSATRNTTGSDEEVETVPGPSPCDDVSSQEDSLPVSIEEQAPSLTKENDFSSFKGRVVNASVQTEEETTLLHKETQASAEAEIVTEHLPAKEDDAVGSEDTTEKATADQTTKKEEKVVPREVPKSYAEVLKSGDISVPSSPPKQQKGSHLKEKKKSAGHSSPKVKKFNLKAKQRPQMSPPPTAPTRSSAPQQTLDEEGFQVVKYRRSTKESLLSKSTRAEIGQKEKKVDSNDVNPFSVLMVNAENLQESENISDIDDNAVSDTEEPGRKELGESHSATRMTRGQKKREKRRSAQRKKKNISREEERQTRSRRKPSSSIIGTGGTPSLQGSAPRQQMDELWKEESAGCLSPKAGTNLKKKQRPQLSQSPTVPTLASAPQEKLNNEKMQVTKGKGKLAKVNIMSTKVDPVARDETQQKGKNALPRNSNNASDQGGKESTTAPTTATASRVKSSPSFPSYFSKKDCKTRKIKSAQAVNKTKKTQSDITRGNNEKIVGSGVQVKQTKTSLARAARLKKDPPSLDSEQINHPQGQCNSNNVGPVEPRKRKTALNKRDKPGPGNISRQKEQPTSSKEKPKTPSNVGSRPSIPQRRQGRGTRGSKKTMMVDDLKIRSVHAVDPAKKKTLRNNTTEKSAPQVKQTKTSMARSRVASFRKDRPPLDSKQNQPYSLKDARPTDWKKKESTWSKKDKPGPGNPGRQEKQQTRPKKRPNTSSNVGTGPSIPGSRHGIYSGSRNSKRTMVDGKDVMIRSVQAVDRAKKTPQRNSTTEKSAPHVKQTKTSLARSVHAMDRTKKKTQRNNTTEKSAPQVKETKTSLARARKVKPKPTKIAIISPYVRQPRSLNNQRASHRRRNIRYPDYGTINIVHNPLSSTSGVPNLPRSLSQDGLYNNMRGWTDHREDCWQSGLSAVESAWHWADGHTANRERRMDHVLAQLLSGLPDQSIGTIMDTTGPSGDVAMPNQSLDDVSYIRQEAEHLGDGLIYTLPEEEDAAQASEEEVSQQELSLPETRTMCHPNANSSNHSTRNSHPSNGNQDDHHSRFQTPRLTSTRDEVNVQENVPVTSSTRRGGSHVHPVGRPPDAAVMTSPVLMAKHCGGRPPEEGRVTPSQQEGRSSKQSQAPRIDRTYSFQDQSSSATANERDQSEERISSCGGARPVCIVKPFKQQAPACSCNSIDQGSTRLLHLGGAIVKVLDNAGQHLCTKRTPLTPVQNFARSIQAIVFGDLVLMSFTLRCCHGNIIPWETLLGYEDTTVQVFPADGQVPWSWKIVIDAEGFCELEHQEHRNEDEDQH
ncbi:zinc finger CCCH domain-containing protein 18-like [Branchiostoma lanceolatum]|uniref:zinc finger CCCH domain-containing protein 18-like n=1 Tax=Branchiostoma lanceolatum TaxID=7740 RepID=UPI003451B2D4